MCADRRAVIVAGPQVRVALSDPDGRTSTAVPALLGAIGAVVPTALRGALPPVGLGACGLWGWVGALGGSVLWAPAGAIRASAGLEASGVVALAFARGRPLAAQRAASLCTSGLLTAIGAAAGVTAGLLAGLTVQATHRHFAAGFARGPSVLAVVGALAAGVLVTSGAWLLARANGRPGPSLMVWRATVLAFLALTGAAPWFRPAARVASLLPLASVWPITTRGDGAALLAVRLTLPTRCCSAAAWITIGIVAARWREPRRSLIPPEDT